MDFGAVSAYRMIDEGMILQGEFAASEVKTFKKNNFANKIYRIENGEFGDSVKRMYGDLYDILGYEHYVIVTLNYVIEIASQWKPIIEVISK